MKVSELFKKSSSQYPVVPPVDPPVVLSASEDNSALKISWRGTAGVNRYILESYVSSDWKVVTQDMTDCNDAGSNYYVYKYGTDKVTGLRIRAVGFNLPWNTYNVTTT
jgi:hypothetical protein